jgi:hypothetical protein
MSAGRSSGRSSGPSVEHEWGDTLLFDDEDDFEAFDPRSLARPVPHFNAVSIRDPLRLLPRSVHNTKEFVLLLQVNRIEGLPIPKSRLPFQQKRLEIVANNVRKSTKITPSRMGAVGTSASKKLRKNNHVSTYTPPPREHTFLWDYGEYYGPSSITVSVVHEGMRRRCIEATATLELAKLLSMQEKSCKEKTRSDNRAASSGDSCHDSGSDDGSKITNDRQNQQDPHVSPYGTEVAIELDPSLDSADASRIQAEPITLHFTMRLFQLDTCVKQAQMQGIHSPLDRGLTVSTPTRPPYKCSEFHYAIRHAPADVVAALLYLFGRAQLTRRAVSLRDSDRHTALDLALLRGDVAVVKELLQRVGNMCFIGTGPSTNSAVHSAVRGGDMRCFKTLLRFLYFYARQILASSDWVGSFRIKLDWVDEVRPL